MVDLNNSGIWDWGDDAEVNGDFVNTSTGSIHIGVGGRVTIFGTGNHSNAGRIDVIGSAAQGQAQFESAGPLTNAASTGLITGRSATLRFDGGLINQGSLALSFGISDVFGNIANTGSIVIAGGANVTFYDDVDQQGSLVVSAVGNSVSTAVFFGAFTGDGFTGGGDVHLLGDLRPGNSPGDILMQGNLFLSASTTTQIELGGLTLGVEYDSLSISGDVQFAGSLAVELIDVGEGLFEPRIGDQFVIATYASHSGEFAIERLPALSQPGASWQIDYGDEALTLSIEGLAGAVDGDVDGDGNVDRRDIVLFLQGFGTDGNAQWSDGDFDFDKSTTLLDLARLQSNLGTQLPSSAAAVPEPSAILLALVSLVGLCIRRKSQ